MGTWAEGPKRPKGCLLYTSLSNQKGLDLVDCVIADIMNEKVQMAVLGMGDARYTNLFLSLIHI